MKLLFGILLGLALALGLVPGMSLTAYADGTPPEVTVTPNGAGTVTVEPFDDGESSPGWLCTATSAEDYTFLRLSSTDPSGVTQNAQGNPAIVPLDTSKVEAKYYKPSDGGYFIDMSKVGHFYDYDELATNAPSLPYTTTL